MTLHYLGPERYGIWVTMISMLAWLSMVDLGIANGLTPALSEAFGKDRGDLAREYVATACWGLAAVAMLAGIVISILWAWIDWGRAFNIRGTELERQVATAMALAVGLFLANLPLSINQRIFLAYQEGATGNAWQLLNSVAGVAGIYVVTLTQGSLVYLVLGYSGAQLLVSLACTIWLFGWSKPQLRPTVRPNLVEAKHVLSIGGLFFICQIASLIMFQKDNILITHYLGPAEAAPYSVTWQLFFYLNAVHVLLSPYLGPGFGEAMAKGDLQWMRKAFRGYMLATCAVAVPAVALLTWFHRPVLAAWVGPNLVPTPATVYWMAVWSLLLAILSPAVSLLVGVGRLRRYTFFNIVAALFSLIISIAIIRSIGVAGVVMASVISILALVVLPALYEVREVLGYSTKQKANQ
jgi:O-antigen/teichoic acid export membrane protein